MEQKQFSGRKEDGGLQRPKLGILPQGAKLGGPVGGVSGWLGVSRRALSSMEAYDIVEKRRAKEIRPNPGIKPRSPALQADSLPAEPWGKQIELEGIAKDQ